MKLVIFIFSSAVASDLKKKKSDKTKYNCLKGWSEPRQNYRCAWLRQHFQNRWRNRVYAGPRDEVTLRHDISLALFSQRHTVL